MFWQLGLTQSSIEIARGDPRVQPLVMTTIADNDELLEAIDSALGTVV